MQPLPIERRRVRFALISAFLAEIKAPSGRGALRLPSLTSVFNQAEEIPMHRSFLKKSVEKIKKTTLYTLWDVFKDVLRL